MRTRSYSRGAIAILLTFGLVSGGGIAASATTPPPTSKSIQDNESFEDDLADGFEVLFTEILQLDSNGTWKINEGELSKHPEIDRAKINEVALALTELERLEGSGKLSETRYQTQGKKEFGMCVLKGIIPGAGLVSIDWGKVYSYIKQKTWGKLSKYLAKHAAKIGAKELAKITPVGLASSVPIAAVGCAIWGY